jgi:hypothetical protein
MEVPVPVAYTIDPSRRLIRTRCTGDTTLTEVMEHFDLLQKDSDCPQPLDVLLDLTGVTSLPASYQLRAVADRIRRIKKPRFGICAIVAGQDVMFNRAVRFRDYAKGQFQELEVFRQTSEAERWLAESAGSSRR